MIPLITLSSQSLFYAYIRCLFVNVPRLSQQEGEQVKGICSMGLMGEFKQSSMKMVLLAETLLSIYFDRAFFLTVSRTEHEECLTLQNRVPCDVKKGKALLDEWFVQLLDEIEMSQQFQRDCSSFISILSDLWQSRLNPTGVAITSNDFYHLKIPCFCQSDLLDPLYRYHCLRKLLELVVLASTPFLDRFSRQEIDAELVRKRGVDCADEDDIGATTRCRCGRAHDEYHSYHLDAVSRLRARGDVAWDGGEGFLLHDRGAAACDVAANERGGEGHVDGGDAAVEHGVAADRGDDGHGCQHGDSVGNSLHVLRCL